MMFTITPSLDCITDQLKLIGLSVYLLSGYELSSHKKLDNERMKYQISVDPIKDEITQALTIENILIFYARTHSDKSFTTNYAMAIYHIKSYLKKHQEGYNGGTI